MDALRLVFDPSGDLLQAARACEADIFREAYGNSREQLETEYASYEANTTFLAVADERDQVFAVARVLSPGGRLKTLDDVGREPWSVDPSRSVAAARIDLTGTWDATTIGVRPGMGRQQSRLAFAIYHGVLAVARANDASSFVAMLDNRVRRLLNSVGIVTHALPGTVAEPYLGSLATTPVYAHLVPMFDNQRRNLPDAYRLVTMGAGLEGIDVPPLDHFRYVAKIPVAWQSVMAPLAVG